MSLQKLLCSLIQLCTLRYICIYFAIILLPVPSVAEDTSRNGTATGGLINCKLTSRGNTVCTSPYLNLTICLFILLALVVIVQCTLLLRLTWHRQRKEDDHDVNITEQQEGTYSRINQAEFISSLSGKLERNDSIGSSSLNFLSPDLAASVNSLCNVCSLSDQEAESKRSAPPATLRQDTLVYCEIGNDPENRHSCQYNGRLNSVSSNQSTHYAFIKSLIVEEGGNSRPWSSSEIPFLKNGILRQEVRCKQGHNVSTKQDDFSRPLNVQADVHASPERKGSTSSSTHGDEDTIKRDRLASYLEIVGDGNDRGVEEKNLRTSSDDDE